DSRASLNTLYLDNLDLHAGVVGPEEGVAWSHPQHLLGTAQLKIILELAWADVQALGMQHLTDDDVSTEPTPGSLHRIFTLQHRYHQCFSILTGNEAMGRGSHRVTQREMISLSSPKHERSEFLGLALRKLF